MNGYTMLSFDDRRIIETMYANGDRPIDIAVRVGKSVATIYAELKRGYTGELDDNKRPAYSAELAQTAAQENIRRRGRRPAG